MIIKIMIKSDVLIGLVYLYTEYLLAKTFRIIPSKNDDLVINSQHAVRVSIARTVSLYADPVHGLQV